MAAEKKHNDLPCFRISASTTLIIDYSRCVSVHNTYDLIVYECLSCYFFLSICYKRRFLCLSHHHIVCIYFLCLCYSISHTLSYSIIEHAVYGWSTSTLKINKQHRLKNKEKWARKKIQKKIYASSMECLAKNKTHI